MLLSKSQMEQIQKGLTKLLRIIINETYKETVPLSTLNTYKEFNIVLKDKVLVSKLGQCDILTGEIDIYGITSYCRRDILITLIHEVSHLIEFKDTGVSEHGKNFYKIHKELLGTAIDLNVLSVEDITENQTSFARNSAKLAKMFVSYKKKNRPDISCFMDTAFLQLIPQDVKQDAVLKVKCIPEEKNILKENGYFWNNKEFCWEKTTKTVADFRKERDFLKKNGFLYYKLGNEKYFAKYIRVCVFNALPRYKDSLLHMGYNLRTSSYGKEYGFRMVSVGDLNKEIFALKLLAGVTLKFTF